MRAKTATSNRLHFWCPGCNIAHGIRYNPGGEDTHVWEWNGDREKPTISPSILVQGGSYNHVCHSFVRDGQIQFLSDCTHELAGQTVELPEWPYGED